MTSLYISTPKLSIANRQVDKSINLFLLHKAWLSLLNQCNATFTEEIDIIVKIFSKLNNLTNSF